MRLNSFGYSAPFFMFNNPYYMDNVNFKYKSLRGKAYRAGNSQRKKRKLARQTGNY